jgi:hypothetical protein
MFLARSLPLTVGVDLLIMSSKSKLSTLLQYRFVKKPREKISVEGRDNEKTNTDESDNSQESQNGSGIHTVTDNNGHRV